MADFGLTAKDKLGVTGTPYWMAPELLAGNTNTVESDVYAFGMTLWAVGGLQQRESLQGIGYDSSPGGCYQGNAALDSGWDATVHPLDD